MKIYVIGRTLPEKRTGMYGLFEFQQARALKNEGNEVHYVFFDSRSVKVNHCIKRVEKMQDGVHVHGFIMPLKGLPTPVFNKIKSFIYKKLIGRVLELYGEPDVIHIHFPLLSITPEIWDYLKNKKDGFREKLPQSRKVYVTEHWTKVQEKDLSKQNLAFLKKIYKETDYFICVSELLKKSIQEICGGKREIAVVPNMVSDVFSFKSQEKHEGIRFVSAGRLVEVKAYDVLISAFAEDFYGIKDVSLTIIGGGKLYERLAKQVKELNMQEQIILTGVKSSEEVAAAFKKSDIYVSASRLETFGVPFAEAWSTGLPCIAADNIPIKEYFSGDNGLLFTVDDKKSLMCALMSAYQNYRSYDAKKIAMQARERFSEKSVAQKLMWYFSNEEE